MAEENTKAVKKPTAKKTSTKKATIKKAPPKKTTTKKTSAKIKNKKSEPKNMSTLKNDMDDFKTQTSEGIKDTAAKGKAKASEAMGGISDKIRETAETIDDSLGEKYGGFARNAADSIDDFAGKLNDKNIDDIVDDTRSFIRKSPALAIGAAAAVGFLITRIIRAGKDDT